MNMRSQVKRSMKVLKRSDKEGVIPNDVLFHAKGIVFMTQIKGAYLFSGTLGSGIFMKRLANDRWSPPASIGMASFGAGLQIGAQKADIVIVLNDESSVKAFESHGQLKLGGDYMISAGPMGRTAKAELGLSGKGFSGCFSYSMSQGLFIGVSLEGTVLLNRSGDNRSFYGTKEAHLSTVLSGTLVVPEEKEKRKNVKLLHRVLLNLCNGRPFENGLDDIDNGIDVTEYDDLDTAVGAERPTGHNNKNDDDLLRRKSLDKQKELTRAASSKQQQTTDLAASGKDLLVGALDASSNDQKAPGWGGEDLLGLSDYSTPAQAPVQAPTQAYASPVQATVLTTATATATASATATATASLSSSGRGLTASQSDRPLLAGLGNGDPQVNLAYWAPRLLATQDHLIDENSPQMMAHNIIALERGDPCFLLDGTLEVGLAPPYQDYVTVQRLSDGKTGKVSKYCLTPSVTSF